MFSKTQILGVATATSTELVAGAATLASTKAASVANAVRVVPKFTATLAKAVSGAKMANFAAKFAKMAKAARKFTAKFTAFAAVILVAFALTACDSGPNLEVSLVSDTTNLQKEAGFGGLVDWGQAGQISVDRQIVKITSLEEEGVDIFKVVFNQGNCGDGYDAYALDKAGAEKAKKEFYAQLPKIDEIFFVADEQYVGNNVDNNETYRDIYVSVMFEYKLKKMLDISNDRFNIDKKQLSDIKAIIRSKEDKLVEYAIKFAKNGEDMEKAQKAITAFAKKEIGDEIAKVFNAEIADKLIMEILEPNNIYRYDSLASLIRGYATKYSAGRAFSTQLKFFREDNIAFLNTVKEKGVKVEEVDGEQYRKQYTNIAIHQIFDRDDNSERVKVFLLPAPKVYKVVSLPEPPPYTHKHKIHLDYGENKDFAMYAKKCKIKKVEIETDKGNAAYTF